MHLMIAALLSLWLAGSAVAASITLDSDVGLANKDFSIEARFQVLADGKLTGNQQDIVFDPLLDPQNVRVPAKFSIRGLHELGLDLNLYDCGTRCKWRIVLAGTITANSTTVQSICMRQDGSMAGLYEKYFFCRKAFQGFFAAQGTCWPEAINALRGWFDAAYTLHTSTLQEGIAFFARDKYAEAFVKDSVVACRNQDVPRISDGYYKGMFVQLDRAKLQATQKVDRLLKQGDMDTARLWAEVIVQDIGTDRSVHDAVSIKETTYIEAILNRALQSDPPFVLP